MRPEGGRGANDTDLADEVCIEGMTSYTLFTLG